MPTRLSVLGFRVPERAFERKRVIPLAAAIVLVLIVIEWYHALEFSLGIFYTVPVIIAALGSSRWQSVLFGLLCACVRGFFTPASSDLEFFLKFVMAAIAYCGAGLLIVEFSENRRRVLEHYVKLRMERDLRFHAEEQLRILAESSPAAILTLNAKAEVLAANYAAHEMLGFPPGGLVGKRLERQIPDFVNALKLAPGERPIRTSITGWARRADDSVFPIQAWFSVYGQSSNRCLAAIVVDVSEEVRDRERVQLRQLLDYNRLLAGAVSHEIRNFCSAITVVCSNLGKKAEVHDHPDFEALRQLVRGLATLASFELRQKGEDATQHTDLKAVLNQLRIVIETDWDEIEGSIEWQIPEVMPPVSGDPHGLLQIFLNLCQNSLRAVGGMPQRKLSIEVSRNSGDAVVIVSDSGPGVADEHILFHPFRPEADGSGLGLFISRELARSFGGDLVHVRTTSGCKFQVMIPFTVATPLELTHVSN